MGDIASQTGDRLAALYCAEQRGLTAAAWMILGSQESAEDAVQHGFATIGGRDLSGIDNPAAYLRTVVMNHCRHELRRRRCLELHDTVPEVGCTDEMNELATVLDRLSPRRRMAVVLRYWCDLPVNEIAQIMDCRPSTVSSLLHRSHASLREILDAD